MRRPAHESPQPLGYAFIANNKGRYIPRYGSNRLYRQLAYYSNWNYYQLVSVINGDYNMSPSTFHNDPLWIKLHKGQCKRFC